MKNENSIEKDRTRNWTFILYPDSAPENWRDILDELHLEWVESPLHDKDLNPTGELKKAHYHVLLLFGGNKSYEQILELISPLNCTIPQKVANAKSLVRYMAHLDNPDKVQYKKSDIVAHGGIELADLLKQSASTRYLMINEMLEYIESNQVMEIQDLMNYARLEKFEDWFPLLCDNSAYIVNQYIKSQRHRAQARVIPSPANIDAETGEILG